MTRLKSVMGWGQPGEVETIKINGLDRCDEWVGN